MPLRIAVLANLAPRKLGSLEDWLVALAREAGARGHVIDVLAREPILPRVAQALRDAGAGWAPLDALERAPLAAVRRLRRYDVLHLNLFAARSRAALLAYAAWPVPVVFVDHHSGFRERPGSAGRLKRWALNRVTVPRIRRLLGVSEYVRRRAEEVLGLPPERTATVYNGVDLARFAYRAPADRPSGSGVLAVANLIPDKGLDHLVRAAARLAPAVPTVTVVGDGPDEPRLRRLAAELGLADRVRFAGLRDDVQGLLAESTLFVHPAVWEEAFGLTIAEAMACGCPVVASRVGGIPELIEDGVSGLLVPPGDPDALAAAMRRVLTDAALRTRCAEAARARAEERFGLDRCAAEHISWCERAATS